MKFDFPTQAQIPQLRRLWKETFGDSDDFLDAFFTSAFSPDRCRCIPEEDRVCAALYWFDISCRGRKMAYVYAVSTATDCRGRGMCRALMADTAALLRSRGYAGALLVPQDAPLFSMYGKMGYLPASGIREEILCADPQPLELSQIPAEEYARLRLSLLAPEGVVQEGENLAFLEKTARFYRGKDFLAAASREPEHLRILEYLGDDRHCGGLIAALGRTEATVRRPGYGKDFSMYLPLSPDCPKPSYFAFCFD